MVQRSHRISTSRRYARSILQSSGDQNDGSFPNTPAPLVHYRARPICTARSGTEAGFGLVLRVKVDVVSFLTCPHPLGGAFIHSKLGDNAHETP